jgi:putative ABC transport system substrate-binding protein
MRRREFITLLGGAVAGWPLSTRAQQSAKPLIIGYLSPTSASTEDEWMAAFVRRLHELGWIEGSTLKIEYRWPGGNASPATPGNPNTVSSMAFAANKPARHFQ